MTTVLWIQRDLRIKDNSALSFAIQLGQPVLPIFIFSPEEDHPWQMGAASRWWLHHSLTAFNKALKDLGMHLRIEEGSVLTHLEKVIKESKASHLVWNRSYEPSSVAREKKVAKMADSHECEHKSFEGALFFEPGQVMTQQDKPYTVFTPFWRACLKENVKAPLSAPRQKAKAYRSTKSGLDIQDLKLLPKIHWDKEFYDEWTPGEEGAWKRASQFVKKGLEHYHKDRDFPSLPGTSHLSPHLHFGEITPRQLWHAFEGKKGADAFLREVGWREFAYHLLYFFPKTPLSPLREEFENFPWKKDAKKLKVWQKGLTGVPIVDAGMRQLWKKGWMHNRVRMIVGSYLVKDLMIPWQEGTRWFWDTLVDADLANNTLGWQWVAGCGADAAPYFRIFNPTLQGERFDPEGDYVRAFVPELKKIPAKWIHKPHLAPEKVLEEAGVVLGKDYPYPMVDHDLAREEALKVYKNRTK